MSESIITPVQGTPSPASGRSQEGELLKKWNATERPYPLNRCVQEITSEKAAAFPQAIAVAGPQRVLRYEDLELRSNRLANLLRQRGVGPDVCVGLFTGRSPDMVVGALGILKAGGAYVPIDPTYPRERISFLLNDAQVGVVLAQPETAAMLPSGSWQTVILDPRAGDLSAYSSEAPKSGVKPHNLAYVIYTSGSTGQPKGVEITHASLMNLVYWHLETFEVVQTDRATLFTSPGFDAVVWEVWPYLTSGASLHLPEETARLSPEILRDWLLKEKINISFVPTAVAEHLLRLVWPEEASLRYLLTGADTLYRRPAAGLPFKFINNYGPTECTVVATSGEVSPGSEAEELPSIGRPIFNTEAWILDEQMQLTPIGEPGELFISGAGLARGYRNRPDLTAERFLPHPFHKNQRIYRTGDLARYLPDGQIAFLGRADDQIKIRGFRIEPGEIVLALNRHAGVRESVVIAREEVRGERRLVAYFVAASGAAPSENELAEHLRGLLPEYMVPTAFVALPALPMTSHGKIDREALPSPDALRAEREREDEYIAPRTPVEERLSEILASLMGLERVSVHENFFLLGGHSLLGTQVIARVRDSFGIEMPLRSLFDAPTVADLSSEIERLIVEKLESGQAGSSKN